MGTTQKTQQTNAYDPGALSTYQGLQGGLGGMLNSYMNNPFGNPFFQTQQQLGTRQAQGLGQTGTSNLLRNMTASNMFGGASSPAGLEMLQNQNRANTGLQANLGFLSPVQSALGMQQYAGGLASQYRPLQTGQNQVQSTSGLGTWLPQVAGLGMGIAGAAMGMPGLGGAMERNVGGIGASNAIGSTPFGNFNPGMANPSTGWAGLGGGAQNFGGGGGMSTLGGMFPGGGGGSMPWGPPSGPGAPGSNWPT